MSRNLPLYQCHKQVRAAKIERIAAGRADGNGPGQTLHFVDAVLGPSGMPHRQLAPQSVGEDYIAKHRPQEGGYYVVYDGYESYSPAKAFEDGYTLVESL